MEKIRQKWEAFRERVHARIERMVHTFFYPDIKFALIYVPLALAALVGCFELRLYHYAASVLFYLAALYALLIVAAAVMKLTAQLPPVKNPLARKFLDDAGFSARVMLGVGGIMNLFFAGLKIATGITVSSLWLASLGVYYASVGLVQIGLMIGALHGDERGKGIYRGVGGLLVGLSLAMSAVLAGVLLQGQHYKYPRFLIYVIAAFTFYKLFSAFASMIMKRREENWCYKTSRHLEVCTAVMSMLALQTALFDKFGSDVHGMYVVSILLGIFAMVVMLAIGLDMLDVREE